MSDSEAYAPAQQPKTQATPVQQRSMQWAEPLYVPQGRSMFGYLFSIMIFVVALTLLLSSVASSNGEGGASSGGNNSDGSLTFQAVMYILLFSIIAVLIAHSSRQTRNYMLVPAPRYYEW